MILLEDVVEVPDLDAPVQAGGDDAVVSARCQWDHVQDPLEMRRHDLAEPLCLQGPDIQLLPNNFLFGPWFSYKYRKRLRLFQF